MAKFRHLLSVLERVAQLQNSQNKQNLSICVTSLVTLPKQPELSLSALNLHSNLSNFDKTFINEKNSFILTKSELKIVLFFGILVKNVAIPQQHFATYFTRLLQYFLIFGQ